VATTPAKDQAADARQVAIYTAMASNAAKFAIDTIKSWKASTPQQRQQNTAQLFQMMKQLPAQYQRMAVAGYGRWWASQPASFKNSVLRTPEMQALITAIQRIS